MAIVSHINAEQAKVRPAKVVEDYEAMMPRPRGNQKTTTMPVDDEKELNQRTPEATTAAAGRGRG